MRALACILLVAVFLRSSGSFQIADMTGMTPAAVHFLLGAAMEATCGVTLAWLLLTWRETPWRNVALFAAGMVVFEAAQRFSCRVVIADIRALPPRTDLCDFVTGLPVAATVLILELLAAIFLLGRCLRTK